jgi:hypothetical protein
VLCWKTVLVLARMLLEDYPRLQAISLLVASAMIVWHYARWPPYHHHHIGHIQVGTGTGQQEERSKCMCSAGPARPRISEHLSSMQRLPCCPPPPSTPTQILAAGWPLLHDVLGGFAAADSGLDERVARC